MARVSAVNLPKDSLLAKHAGPEEYTDCFMRTVPGEVSLSEFITRFYSSWAFLPERKLLGLIGRGANHADIAALAEGRTESFAAWDVIGRRSGQHSTDCHSRESGNPDCNDGGSALDPRVQPAAVLRNREDDTNGKLREEILLRDFQGRTASWLRVEPSEDGNSTNLYFGSLVTTPNHPAFKALMGFHVFYSKLLLGGV